MNLKGEEGESIKSQSEMQRKVIIKLYEVLIQVFEDNKFGTQMRKIALNNIDVLTTILDRIKLISKEPSRSYIQGDI